MGDDKGGLGREVGKRVPVQRPWGRCPRHREESLSLRNERPGQRAGGQGQGVVGHITQGIMSHEEGVR